MLLALDADAAGQEAMLRGARVAARRNLTLRVVALPPGSDPADLVAQEGARAMADRVDASVPFVRFRVERELEKADLSSSQGKQAVFSALAPVFAELELGAVSEEIVRLVSDRTNLPPELTKSLLLTSHGASATEESRPTQLRRSNGDDHSHALDAPGRAERSFLAQCIAAPNAGREALTELDLDAVFTSRLTRRGAAYVRDRLGAELTDVPPEDEELALLIAELVVRAGQMRSSDAAVEGERLNLELLRIEREITAARTAAAGDVTPLVTRRQELKRRRDGAIARAMDETHATD
jgi:DNA primase